MIDQTKPWTATHNQGYTPARTVPPRIFGQQRLEERRRREEAEEEGVCE